MSSLAFEVFPVLCVQLLNRYHSDTLSVTCVWFIEAVNVPLEMGAQEEGTQVPPPETFPKTAKGIVRFSGRTWLKVRRNISVRAHNLKLIKPLLVCNTITHRLGENNSVHLSHLGAGTGRCRKDLSAGPTSCPGTFTRDSEGGERGGACWYSIVYISLYK